MIEPVKGNVIKFRFKEFSSNVYLLRIGKKTILIDTGSKQIRTELIKDLNSLSIKPEEIEIILLTHSHYDHVGNLEIFPNAVIYGNKNDFPQELILDIKKFDIPELQILEAPGHTKGSTCIFFKDEKILFSGDVLFEKGVGRTDLPESVPEEMQNSLEKLSKLDYKILCPGH